MKLSNAVAVLALSSLFLAACGSDGEFRFELRGRITNQDALATPAVVRAAFLWVEPGSTGVFRTAQETEVNAEFPAYFRIEIDQPPPGEVMVPLERLVESRELAASGIDPAARVAIGTVIIYDDGNQNGVVDFHLDGRPSPDTVLGASQDTSILFVEGEGFGIADLSFTPGFNLVMEQQDETCVEVCNPGQPECPETCNPTTELRVVPPQTEIEIPLTSDPDLARLLCQDPGDPCGIFGGGDTIDKDDYCPVVGYVPCEGDILGAWKLRSLCPDDPEAAAALCEHPYDDLPQCTGAGNEAVCDNSASGTLTFKADGTVEIDVSVSLAATYNFTDECLAVTGRESLPPQDRCLGMNNEHLACTYQGSCTCVGDPMTSGDLTTATWETDGGNLTIGEDAPASWCVDGDRLTMDYYLYHPDSWRYWVLER